MVATDRHLERLAGITEAAVARGHVVRIFATDAGTRLLAEPRFAGLSALPGVSLDYCDQSARRHGGRPAGLPAAIRKGSQFENAVLVAESDKLVVL